MDLLRMAFTHRGACVQFLGAWWMVAHYFTQNVVLDDGPEALLTQAILLMENLILMDEFIPLGSAAGIPFDQEGTFLDW
jgi:hypothetical protein